MWKPIQLPYIFERMIAFSIPAADVVWILSYEGLHRLTLVPRPEVWTEPKHAEDYGLLDADGTLLVYAGQRIPMLGLYGGEPLLRHPKGQQLAPHFDSERVDVLAPDGSIEQAITFKDLSGDWGFATFSADGRYLLVGIPYELHVYQHALNR